MSNVSPSQNQDTWLARIEQQRQSGLSMKEWCREHDIPVSTFYYWNEKLSPKTLQKSSFTELAKKKSETVSLQTRGLSVRIDSNCAPEVRKQLFLLFAEVSC